MTTREILFEPTILIGCKMPSERVSDGISVYAKSPQSVCIAARAASGAVSVRKIRLPSVTA